MRSKKKKSRKRASSQEKMSYGNLEERRLLAVATVTSQGVLLVEGGNQAETIDVQKNGNGDWRVYHDADRGGPQPGKFIPIRNHLTRTVRSIKIVGEGGNDLLVNRTDVDSRIEGGDGDDTIVGGSGNDRANGGLFGGPGNDLLFGDFGVNESVNPGAGGSDILSGGDGNDIIRGRGGNDTLRGDDGNDILWGGADDDLISGLVGNDRLFGEDGNDTFFGGAGNDYLAGGTGNDNLNGQSGNDNILPGPGVDVANGGGGHDYLQSTAAGGSSNTLVGGIGNDTYRFFGPGLPGVDVVQERSGEGAGDRLLVQVDGGYQTNQAGVNILTYGAGPRFVLAQDNAGNPLTGNIERIQGIQEVPVLSDFDFDVSTFGQPQTKSVLSFVATDDVGLRRSLTLSRGILNNVLVQVRNQSGRTVQVEFANLAPTRIVPLSSTEARFEYDISAQINNAFDRINTNTIGARATFARANIGANQVFDRHGNGNLADAFLFQT